MSHRTSAEVVLDSVTPYGLETRLTSVSVIFPKMILGERNRHRGFSLSDRSSRAVPSEKLIEEVRADPAMPAKFRYYAKGMGGADALVGDALEIAQAEWCYAATYCSERAEHMARLGLAKEIANRPLDPFIRMHSLMTGTRDVWLNFLGLRLDAGADPTIQVLAQKCFEAIRASTPRLLQPGEWHLPFIDQFHDHAVWAARKMKGHPHFIELGWEETAKRWSAARCAHLSYKDLETGLRMTVEKALTIYDRLIGSRPIHASPCEHQGLVDEIETYQLDIPEVTEEQRTKREISMSINAYLRNAKLCGNFAPGWIQARKMLPGEAVADLPEGYAL